MAELRPKLRMAQLLLNKVRLVIDLLPGSSLGKLKRPVKICV